MIEAYIVRRRRQIHDGFDGVSIRVDGGERRYPAATTHRCGCVLVVVEVDHAALGADGEGVGGYGEGGGDRAILVVKALHAPTATDVKPLSFMIFRQRAAMNFF